MRDVLQEANHLPSRHFRKLIIVEHAQVEQLLLDALLRELSKISVRAGHLFWIFDGWVDRSPARLCFSHALVGLDF